MAKGKGKISSSGSLAPPQPRSLRSRKKESPSDEIPHTQAALHQQDTGENNTTVVGTPLQCPKYHVQENQQDQTVGLPCLTSKEEKHAEETNVFLKNIMVEAFAGQKETNVTSPSNDAEVLGFRVYSDNDTNRSGIEGITSQEGVRSPSQTCTDQLGALLPTSEEDDGSCAPLLKKQLAVKDNSQCNLVRNHENSQEEPSNMCVNDIKEITKEAEAGLPAKKKRRMGMCGLTEKEQSHFLQTQKHENAQNRMERVERQIYNSNTAKFMEQSEAEINPSLSGLDDRAETEVQITFATSDVTGTVCHPGCSVGKSCEAEGGAELGPEQTGAPKSDLPTHDEVQEDFVNWEQWELEGNTTEVITEKAEKQKKDGEDRSTEVDCSPAISFHTYPNKNEETEKKKDGPETDPERKGEIMVDADVGAEVETGGCNCGSVELCEAVATPTGSERKESCDPDNEPCPVNAELTQTKDTADPFGSGCSDYVSDSQLNTIVMIEEGVMEREDAGSSGCHEDATDLICGLISELSSLNRKVMATHRELENLRRSSKTPRSSSR